MTGSYEEMLDAARRFTREAIFRVGVQIVEGAARADDAGPALADIAESVIAGLLPKVEDALAASAGRIKGAGFVVVAMGKLGGHETTASSDLDLIFIYDVPPGVEASDGPKPLSPTLYFARLAQRLISALTTPTAAGTLYDVDMRLRPTGNKGPVAVSLESFYRLSRQRKLDLGAYGADPCPSGGGIAGTGHPGGEGHSPPADRCRAKRRHHHGCPRYAGEDGGDLPGNNVWDLKHAPGGLVDIEFIAQSFQLVHAPTRPAVLDTNTIAALHKLKAAGFLSPQDGEAPDRLRPAAARF